MFFQQVSLSSFVIEQSSLLGQFVSYEENEVLWIQPRYLDVGYISLRNLMLISYIRCPWYGYMGCIQRNKVQISKCLLGQYKNLQDLPKTHMLWKFKWCFYQVKKISSHLWNAELYTSNEQPCSLWCRRTDKVVAANAYM